MTERATDERGIVDERCVMLTPSEYERRFEAREALGGRLAGVCGRFIRGVDEKDFSLLSEEPGKRLSWICGPELLQPLLGMTATEALHHIGHSLEWMEARLHDGTKHKLVLFPETNDVTIVTWDNLLGLIKSHFGQEVYDLLMPHWDALKSRSYREIDPVGRLKEISELPVKDKYNHPEFMTVERFQLLNKPVTLYDARAFCYHALGCNLHFVGNGCNAHGQIELMVPNRRIVDIDGAVVIDLSVTAAEIHALRRPAH